jgi:hypothetical protein
MVTDLQPFREGAQVGFGAAKPIGGMDGFR